MGRKGGVPGRQTVERCFTRVSLSCIYNYDCLLRLLENVAADAIAIRSQAYNSLYYGMSNTNFQRLQRVQNAAARIVLFVKLHDANITQPTF